MAGKHHTSQIKKFKPAESKWFAKWQLIVSVCITIKPQISQLPAQCRCHSCEKLIVDVFNFMRKFSLTNKQKFIAYQSIKVKACQLNFVTYDKSHFVLFENMYKISDFNLNATCLHWKQIVLYLPEGGTWYPRTLELKEWLSSFFLPQHTWWMRVTCVRHGQIWRWIHYK